MVKCIYCNFENPDEYTYCIHCSKRLEFSNADNFKFNPEATEPGTNKYAWLFDYTDCKEYGCNIEYSSTWGYWTSTPVASRTDATWFVWKDRLDFSAVNRTSIGLRPVITVSKSLIA